MVAATQRDELYVLGYTDDERQRLTRQAQILEASTRRLFVDAGIGPGMRVLDVGCGAGDVSFLAASLVGEEGAVVGVDTDPRSLALARGRATDRGLTNVEFAEANLHHYASNRPFDAAVGRLVLMYLPDPAEALRVLARQIRPGGILAFQEIQLDFVPFAFPALSLVDQELAWVRQTFRQAGADISMGVKLYDAFVRAALPPPSVQMDVDFIFPADDRWLVMMSDILRGILPLMEQIGVATADDLDLETWVARRREQVAAAGAVHSVPPMVRAWTRTPVA